MLLVERGRNPFAGLLSLPGGRVRFGESLQDAALREVREETGLQPRLAFFRLYEAIGEDHHALIAVHVGRVPEESEAEAASDAISVLWLAPDAIAAAEEAGGATPHLAAIVGAAVEALAGGSG